MYEQILGAIANQSGGGGGSSAVPSSTGASSGGVTIAPGGINLGSILQPFNEGGSPNGGYDIELLSRLGFLNQDQPAYQPANLSFGGGLNFSSPMTWGILAGGVALLLLLKKRGR